MRIPIAVESLEIVEKYIGKVSHIIEGRKRPVNAFIVEAIRPVRNAQVPLWNEPKAEEYYQLLHPERQMWVHVDYAGYRRAWHRLGFGELGSDIFLDHIKNRTATRLAGYTRPFLRICPVSRDTNTNSGTNSGAEGMERAALRKLKNNQQPEHVKERMRKSLATPVVLADPVDITKILNIPPGLSVLGGVAEIIDKFYIS